MNTSNFQRSVLLILASLLCVGLPGLARGQNSFVLPPEIQAALNARRPALATQAAPPPAATISTTTPTGASDDLPALRVAVVAVNESRNSEGRSALILTLSIVGEGLPPSAVVKQITVTKAVDNLGNVLGSIASRARAAASAASAAASLGTASSSMMLMNMPGMGRGMGPGPLTGRASLDAPVREAESLQFVEGTIELFLPSGYDEVMHQIAGVQTSAPQPAFSNGGVVSFRDTSGRLTTQQLQESNGTMIRTSGISRSGGNGNLTGALQLSAALPADAQRVVFRPTPGTTKTVPFRVEDITLP